MKSGEQPCVLAVQALTRLHYRPMRRDEPSRLVAADRKRSSAWGWGSNLVGIGVSLKRVAGVVVDEVPCVRFFVLRKLSKRQLRPAERIPSEIELESASCIAVTDVVVVPGRFVAHASPVRPLRSRAEVGHLRGGRGTLGLVVRKVGTTEMLALSCSHAIARSGDVQDFGRSVEHPVGDQAKTIGRLLDGFSKLRSGTLATDDVALAQLAVEAVPGIAGSPTVPRATSTKLAKDFRAGDPTMLFGSVTQARGRVDSVATTIEVDEVPFVTGSVVFSGLVAYETRSAKGDSGGVVMSGKPGEESLVLGMHTGGRSDGELGLFQPIGPIMERLGLELVL